MPMYRQDIPLHFTERNLSAEKEKFNCTIYPESVLHYKISAITIGPNGHLENWEPLYRYTYFARFSQYTLANMHQP